MFELERSFGRGPGDCRGGGSSMLRSSTPERKKQQKLDLKKGYTS